MPKILDFTTSINTDHQLKPSQTTVLKTAITCCRDYQHTSLALKCTNATNTYWEPSDLKHCDRMRGYNDGKKWELSFGSFQSSFGTMIHTFYNRRSVISAILWYEQSVIDGQESNQSYRFLRKFALLLGEQEKIVTAPTHLGLQSFIFLYVPCKTSLSLLCNP